MKSQTNRHGSSFTGEELEAMRNQAEDDRLLFFLLRWTGLLPIDAIGLTWGEVSLDRHQIEYVVRKNPRKLILPIPAELLSVLRTEHQRRNPQQNEPVLRMPNGKPFTNELLCRRIEALGRRSGVRDAYPRRFRKSFAVELLLRGVALIYVAKLLGCEIETVVRCYLPDIATFRNSLETGGEKKKSQA